VGIGAGAFFSKNLAAPVHDIIENINGLESGQVLKKKKTDGIFTSVFDSLDKLKIRLMSADTERKNAENQRKEWITNVSHDMKTPLSTVKGYAELLMEDGYEISDAERKKYAEKIRNHAETIEKLIEELKFGRLLEDGKIKTQKEEIDLCKLLRECGSEIPFSEKENRLRLEFEKEPMYVTVDKQLMKRCFMNIIGNALVHNNGNAAITILCSQAEKTSIKICDNGKGMERDELSNIFDRYYRGKGAKKTAGSGLGLAIAKEIVQAHDGSITVESEVGKGTIFTITL
jgi:signal transduction histidine kinase